MLNRLLRFLLLLGLVIPSNLLLAQNYDKLLNKGQYEQALDLLNENLKTIPNDIRLNFYKARVYAVSDPPVYDVDSAYLYFNRCLELFNVLRDLKIRDKLNKIPINTTVVRNQINSLLNREFQLVQSINTLEAYAAFMNRFPESRQGKQARELHDELAFKEFSSVNRSMGELKALHLSRPQASTRLMLADEIVKMIRREPRTEDLEFYVVQFPDHEQYLELCYMLYDRLRKDGELKTLLRYYSMVPGLPLNEKQRADYANAKHAWKIGLGTSKGSQGSCFGSPLQLSEENMELNRRLTREGAQTGDLQFSLMWNNFNDIDLHVTDPFGEVIYFGNRSSASGGILDVDMNVHYKMGRYSEQAVENIFWPAGSAPSGKYKVKVIHYLNHRQNGCKDPTEFVVRVRCNGQDTLLKSSLTYNEAKPGKTMLEFEYSMPEYNEVVMTDSIRTEYDRYIKNAGPLELAYMAVLRLMADDLRSRRWDEAILTLSNYSRYFVKDNDVMGRIRELDRILRDDRYTVQIERLGTVNTAAEEYSPVLSADEKLLYFCGRNRPENLGKEDIFVSKAGSRGWEKPALLTSINTAQENEAPLSVSADGNSILLFRSGDIYYATRTSTGWSAPVAFPAPVNTVYWEGDAMIAANGKALLFASNRPGGYNLYTEQNHYHGNIQYASDLYVCELQDDGSWGPAINLGPSVNTLYCERSPFLHPDLKTLYFSSDAWYGMGNLDVFMIRRSSDTSWTSWEKPVNLGRNINTPDADWGYQISTSGEWAYFSAFDETGGMKEELYRFVLPAELRPQAVVALSGRLLDRSGRPVSARVFWVNLQTGEEAGVSTADPVTGHYYVLLTAGHNYGFYAESDSAFSVSGHLDLTDASRYEVRETDISLYRMEELIRDKTALRINNLFFDYDRSTLRPESFPELDRLARIILGYPGLKVEIMGHTDDRGPDDYNLKLSQDRAETVKSYLASRGVDENIMAAVGYGESRPLMPNTTDANRQTNRRVEFRFSR